MNYLIHRYRNNIHKVSFVIVSIVLCSIDIQMLEARGIAKAATPVVSTQPLAQSTTVVKNIVKNEETPISTGVDSKLSLDQIYALSQEKKPTQLPTRSRSITPVQKTTDLYTQSQAHMSIPAIKNLIAATYDTKPYEELIKQIFDREKQYGDYYVFYHGTDNVWRLAQDVYTRLYAHFKKISPQTMKDFIFLRFNEGLNDVAVNNFLINKLRESGLVNDHTLGNDILAVNLALFGNVGTPPECTWQYFIKSRGHTAPTRSLYESIMNTFGLSHTYINELMKLVELYQTKEQTILQIFIPKNMVNAIGYLAWIRGIPADQQIMHTVLRSVQDKTFEKTAPALDHYTQLFKQDQEKQPLFKNVMTKLGTQQFSLDYFLTFYRNRPADIEDINNFQARLFLTRNVLLNPLSGVKIFRCSTATDAQLKKYHEKLDGIIKKMVTEKP